MHNASDTLYCHAEVDATHKPEYAKICMLRELVEQDGTLAGEIATIREVNSTMTRRAPQSIYRGMPWSGDDQLPYPRAPMMSHEKIAVTRQRRTLSADRRGSGKGTMLQTKK